MFNNYYLKLNKKIFNGKYDLNGRTFNNFKS